MDHILDYFKCLILILSFHTNLITCCTSFYCINSCGSSLSNKGYKLILANNRDEDIYRLTQKAGLWPIKNILNELNVYGSLDLKNGAPPTYYSTWLGINDMGNIGNLLFFMYKGPNQNKPKNRGIIVSNYVMNGNLNGEGYLQELTNEKSLYGPYNYVQLVMSEKTGDYSLYYVNNNDTNSYKKMNSDMNKPFIFGLSNSDPDRPFQKAVKGKQVFEEIINKFSLNSNKSELIQSLNKLLQNKTENMPDVNLSSFMQTNDEPLISGISKINANYTTFWTNASTRTSTLILIDYENNVEYYEYNMSTINNWELNAFQFKLKNLNNSNNRIKYSIENLFVFIILFLLF